MVISQRKVLFLDWLNRLYSVDTGRKLNVHKTFRRRPECLLNVLCTFNLRRVYGVDDTVLISTQWINHNSLISLNPFVPNAIFLYV